MNAITGRRNPIMAFLATGASIARVDPVKAGWSVGGCLDSGITAFIGTFGISRAFTNSNADLSRNFRVIASGFHFASGFTNRELGL